MAAAYTSADSGSNDIDTRVEMITTLMDEIITKESKTAAMTADSELVQATSVAGQVKVATAKVSGLGNYSIDDGYQFGSAKLKWATYQLTHDRGLVIDVDRREQMETGGLATAALFASEVTRQSIIPEIDSTRLAGIYAAMNADTTGVKANNLGSYTPAAATVLSEIEKGIDAVSENWTTDAGYTIYISTAVKSLLRSSSEVTKTRDITGGSSRLSTDTTDIDGNTIVWVPKARMKTAYTYNDIDSSTSKDGGIEAASSAQDINFIIIAPGVANGIVSINNEKIIMKNQNQRKDADSLYMRVFHDVIVPQNKVCGAYVSVKPSARDPESGEQTIQTASVKKTVKA